jgi:hypothetical protein
MRLFILINRLVNYELVFFSFWHFSFVGRVITDWSSSVSLLARLHRKYLCARVADSHFFSVFVLDFYKKSLTNIF